MVDAVNPQRTEHALEDLKAPPITSQSSLLAIWVQRNRASPSLTWVLGGRAGRGRVDLFLWTERLKLHFWHLKMCLTAADCADTKKLRSEVASFVRLSCRSSRGGAAGSNALLWPQPRMAQHPARVRLPVPLHGTEITSSGSNTSAGDTQNQLCLLTLEKASLLRRDVGEGISSAPGTWNYWFPMLEQYQPPRDDIPAVHDLPTPRWDAIA